MLLKVEQVGERATPFVLSIRVNSIEREKNTRKNYSNAILQGQLTKERIRFRLY